MLERLEKRPGATLAAFPPPIFTATSSISWFHVSSLPPRENASGGLYIELFRSRWAIWSKDEWHQRSEGQMGLRGSTRGGTVPPGLVWA
jgi:hypothetical protein